MTLPANGCGQRASMDWRLLRGAQAKVGTYAGPR